MRTHFNEESPYVARKENDAQTILGLRNEMQLLLAQSSPDHESIIDWINDYSEEFSELTRDEPQLYEEYASARKNDTEQGIFLKGLREKLKELKQKNAH
ncbi:MAG: hypothetical protein A2942_04050 [Candidatus Lloydbacteria bacterium RIFCSPLOWO2_01_FULL_50_20]|uniref:Uncharacterized protein n=1 Tax=Candidatus Lloydbacteria bacterium RIFCSPLOWO2_01_FULL_50_20 TaxID=1798665 RepID=A0A1G2DEZ6_9BACT|nr:MAG: hypothetical protein A3C13_00205 [Candidatus Lloydbacteria bacterium RIFCSPHIGHO2_02_FULL_50_11]OGZ11358.1 MAG: hypothetical protein A2942_04050 [Candidatus Lloydbacteria bacterium RIFCSPLOWO2_01_FULL_50_20]